MIFKHLYDLFTALIPGISKKNLLETVYSTYGDYDGIITPMYNLDIAPPVGPTNSTLISRFKSELDFGDKNIIKTANMLIAAVAKNQDAVIKAVKETFPEGMPNATMDYYQLNLFTYTENLEYVADFLRRMLNVLVWETLVNTLTDKSKKESDYLEILPGNNSTIAIVRSPSIILDRDYITTNGNIIGFIKAANMLYKPFTAYQKSIAHLKGHLLNSDDWDGSNGPLERQLDPHGAGLIPVPINPFYHAGIVWVTWRNKCNERNKADYGRVQLMLAILNERRRMTPVDDVNRIKSLDKQIQYYDNLSNNLGAAIEDMESEARHA